MTQAATQHEANTPSADADPLKVDITVETKGKTPAPTAPAPAAPAAPAPTMLKPANDSNLAAIAPAAVTPIPTNALHSPTVPPVTDVSPQTFLDKFRIHVKNGSLFVSPYLVVHRQELRPENEAQLRAKLQLTYSLSNPSFYEDPRRFTVALHLASLLPQPLDVQRETLMQSIAKFNGDVAKGGDDSAAQELQNRQQPMASLQREIQERAKGGTDPASMLMLKQGVVMHLLLRDLLTRHNYPLPVVQYVERMGTPDQVLESLAEKTGFTPRQVREAANAGGIEGVAKLFGTDPKVLADIQLLAEYISERDFSLHDIEHWNTGRGLLGNDAPLEEKLAAGMQHHIDSTIPELRAHVKNDFTQPPETEALQKKVATYLNLLEPVERALMDALGYEICFTPDYTADHIAHARGVNGLHRKTADDIGDLRGTYRIYFAGHGNEKDSVRTFIHEVRHNLWPELIKPEEITKIDTLLEKDRQRLNDLKIITGDHRDHFLEYIARYKAAPDDASRQQVLEEAAAHTPEVKHVDVKTLIPTIGSAEQFAWLVSEAHERLQVEGALYNKTDYDTVSSRLREMISRYSELRDVQYRDQPGMQTALANIVPGMTQVFDEIYLPHLHRVLAKIEKERAANDTNALELNQPPEASTQVVRKVENIRSDSDIHPDSERALPATNAPAAAHGAPGHACTSECRTPESKVDSATAEAQARYAPAARALAAMGVHTAAVPSQGIA